MKLLCNLIWLLFGGLLLAAGYFAGACVLGCTIIGLPFAIQLFKIGMVCLLPFSAEVTPNTDLTGCIRTLLNIIWIVCGGLLVLLMHVFFGGLLCITIIGIPWGRQHFKLARICLSPFGKTVKLDL